MSYEVMIFKLVTGEELLCKAEELDFDKWEITDARTLGFNPDGTPGIMPFIQMNPERPFILRDSAIVGHCKSVPPEMEKKYLSDTSGIALS